MLHNKEAVDSITNAEGFPTESAMSDFWDKQKVKTDNGPDNLLDYTHIYREQVASV